ncbi:MAG: transposase [bacterium]
MGLRFPAQTFGTCFFVTTTFRNWRDIGQIAGFYEALAESIQFSTKKYSALVLGYVLMPTHIHLVLVIDGKALSDFMRDFKKFTAQKVAQDLNLGSGGIWMPRYDRVVIYNEDILRVKLNYIHYNLVKSGLVEKPEDWKWSSAGDYILNKTGIIPVWMDWG